MSYLNANYNNYRNECRRGNIEWEISKGHTKKIYAMKLVLSQEPGWTVHLGIIHSRTVR